MTALRIFCLGAIGLAFSLVAAGTAWAVTELDCLIAPQERSVVSAPVIGVVSEVLVKRGDLVEVGQPLARLESSLEEAAVKLAKRRADATAQLQQSEARFQFETRRLERGKKLHGKGVLSIHELDEADSSRLVAEADSNLAREGLDLAAVELERARTALELRTVRSPVRGVVVRRIRAPGEFADPPELVEVAQIDPLRVEAFAPVALLGAIVPEMIGIVYPEGPGSAEYEASVVIVDRVVDARSGTFGIRLELPNPDYSIAAGLKCRVVIDISTENASAPAVPSGGGLAAGGERAAERILP